MEYIGLHGPDDRLVVQRPTDELKLQAFWLDRDNRVTAGMHVNDWGAIEAIEKVIESGEPVDTSVRVST
jgi:3-phenylpropionate/trans-cinnamate dioxygenase ferredoxin reductase component